MDMLSRTSTQPPALSSNYTRVSCDWLDEVMYYQVGHRCLDVVSENSLVSIVCNYNSTSILFETEHNRYEVYAPRQRTYF